MSTGVIFLDLVERVALPLDADLFFGETLLRAACAASAFFALLLRPTGFACAGDERRA